MCKNLLIYHIYHLKLYTILKMVNYLILNHKLFGKINSIIEFGKLSKD
jgi:hypothetical protein